MKTICLFTMKGCQYCKDFKDILKKEGLNYDEYDVDENPDLWNQIVQQVDEENLPTVFIRDNKVNSGVFFMSGLNVETPDEMLKKIKENL